MPDRCKNCGAELFQGARFCRFCGRQTGQLLDEDLPTQIMPDATTRYSPHNTSPVYREPVTHAPVPFSPVPKRSRSGFAWIMTFIAIALFGAMFLGILFMARSFRRDSERPARPPTRAEFTSGEVVLGDDGAEVSSRETIINKTVKIDPAATFSLKNMKGDITIEAWDEPDAEIKVIKRGGREQDRKAAQVLLRTPAGKLELRSAPSRGNVEVNYEVKVPRRLRRIEIESIESELRVTGFAGAISAKIQNGSIELDGVSGSVMTEITNGETRAVFADVTRGERLVFKSVNGDIEVSFKKPVDLDVRAETTVGQIRADDELGLDISIENFVGRRARGQLGAGGQPLEISAVRGDIRLGR